MRRGYAVVALAMLAIGMSPLNASTFMAMSDRDLVGQADAIVQGRVVSQASSWDATGRVIITEAVVRVESVLSGTAPKRVVVKNFGGIVGDLAVNAIGFPEFRTRERVVLFLKGNPDGTVGVLGYQQGHFEVVERLDGVKLAVPRTEEGSVFLNRDGQLVPERQSIRLRDFKRGVRRLARELQDVKSQ